MVRGYMSSVRNLRISCCRGTVAMPHVMALFMVTQSVSQSFSHMRAVLPGEAAEALARPAT